jgi:CelD/BcsL family acetyltransferase involved in cellulose biosynthesis
MTAAWDEIAGVSIPGPLRSLRWWKGWVAARGRSALGVTLRLDDGQPAAVLLLQRRNFGPLRILEPIGARSCPLRPVLVSPACAGRLSPGMIGEALSKAAAAAGGADLVMLPGLPATVSGAAHPFLALGRSTSCGGIAVTHLISPWPRCDARHRGSKSRRKAVRREERLAGDDTLGFHMTASSADRLALARELSGIRAFMAVADLARIEPEEGAPDLWIAVLRRRGRPIAAMVGLAEGRMCQGLLYAADANGASARDTRDALLARSLEAAVERGATRFALPPGIASRLGHWSDEWSELKRVTLALTPLGRLAAAALDHLPMHRLSARSPLLRQPRGTRLAAATLP